MHYCLVLQWQRTEAGDRRARKYFDLLRASPCNRLTGPPLSLSLVSRRGHLLIAIYINTSGTEDHGVRIEKTLIPWLQMMVQNTTYDRFSFWTAQEGTMEQFLGPHKQLATFAAPRKAVPALRWIPC